MNRLLPAIGLAGLILLGGVPGTAHGQFPGTYTKAGGGNFSNVDEWNFGQGFSGTNPVPFTLPAAFRPMTNVYVPVDLCNATNGRLFIQPTGTVTVQAEERDCSGSFCRFDNRINHLPDSIARHRIVHNHVCVFGLQILNFHCQ